jgi:hypothetical protein
LGERLLELVDKKKIEYMEQQPTAAPAPAEETPLKESPQPEDEAKA